MLDKNQLNLFPNIAHQLVHLQQWCDGSNHIQHLISTGKRLKSDKFIIAELLTGFMIV